MKRYECSFFYTENRNDNRLAMLGFGFTVYIHENDAFLLDLFKSVEDMNDIRFGEMVYMRDEVKHKLDMLLSLDYGYDDTVQLNNLLYNIHEMEGRMNDMNRKGCDSRFLITKHECGGDYD